MKPGSVYEYKHKRAQDPSTRASMFILSSVGIGYLDEYRVLALRFAPNGATELVTSIAWSDNWREVRR
jgi:hypothetical protein